MEVTYETLSYTRERAHGCKRICSCGRVRSQSTVDSFSAYAVIELNAAGVASRGYVPGP
jgi:predicted protein tyrosine phosphatase